MSDKLKLLELANKKVADDKDFIAYFLVKYCEIEKTTRERVIDNLRCDIEQYYKLSLCRVPNSIENDYIQRLSTICEYTSIPVLELNKIIKRVNSTTAFLNSNDTFLIAARDKNKRNDEK